MENIDFEIAESKPCRNEMVTCKLEFKKIKHKVEARTKDYMFLLFDKKEIKDRICKFKIDSKKSRLIAITWNGLLQIKCTNGGEPLMKSVVPSSVNNEFCEGLGYFSDSDLIAVSTVKMNQNDKFYQNMIYLYKIEKSLGQKLVPLGAYSKNYSPTKCKLLSKS
jgi:hypothetical protein